MSKYNAVAVVTDGYRFDSKMEERRYQVLKLMERAGEIDSLIVHPLFVLHSVGMQPICKYEADFSYYQGEEKIIEDVKGVKTSIYNLKKKMMLAEYGIKILETKG